MTKGRNMKAALILAGRLTYSLQWFLISPALPEIAAQGKVPTSLLGLIPVAFYGAAGVSQIPSVYIAQRLDPARTYIVGLFLLALGNILLPLDVSTFWLFATRIISGVGAALFFASAAGVLSSLYPSKPGTIMGLYNAFFAMGGGVGLAWGVLDQSLGWQVATELGGLVAVVLAALNFFFIGNERYIPPPRLRGIGQTLRNRTVVAVGLAYTGVWGAYFAVGQLLPSYEQIALGASVSISGLTSSILLFPSILGSFMGVFYGRFRRKRLLLALGAIPAILPAVAIGTGRMDAIVISLVSIGFFDDFGMSMLYAFLVDFEGSDPASCLALVNTFHMLIGMWVAPMLSLASTVSWGFGWGLVGTLPLLPLVLLVFGKKSKSGAG
jgi:predicted MFS family arabinose efflux permease